MPELGHGLRFPAEPREEEGCRVQVVTQRLDGHVALQPHIPGGVDLSEATPAEQ